MVILLIMAAAVIGAVAIFLITNSSSSMSSTEAQRIFASGCMKYCTGDEYEIKKNAFMASQNDVAFVGTCIRLGYMKSGEDLLNCLKKCANCG